MESNICTLFKELSAHGFLIASTVLQAEIHRQFHAVVYMLEDFVQEMVKGESLR